MQQTLSGGVVSAIKAKCEMEVERIDKQFDDCIAFLLRVIIFHLSLFCLFNLWLLSFHWLVLCGISNNAGPLFQAKRGALPSFGRFGY